METKKSIARRHLYTAAFLESKKKELSKERTDIPIFNHGSNQFSFSDSRVLYRPNYSFAPVLDCFGVGIGTIFCDAVIAFFKYVSNKELFPPVQCDR